MKRVLLLSILLILTLTLSGCISKTPTEINSSTNSGLEGAMLGN